MILSNPTLYIKARNHVGGWQNRTGCGLYGVDLVTFFVEKACFLKVANAVSRLCKTDWYLRKTTNCWIVKCTNHLEKLGAFEISRETFMMVLHSKWQATLREFDFIFFFG
jgi:Leu/Phe-tRNA-protein transferase